MAKKKKSTSVEDNASEVQSPAVPATQDPSGGSASGSGSGSKKTAKTKASAQQQPPPVPALIICRNKHWRYISSFHGPWLQLPPEILETLANLNYNTPRPRPIDPSVFFDLVKIRRLVDDATNLAVRAASGVATVSQHSMSGGPHHALGLFGPGGQTKLSRERKHRMREQATQKLSKAYHLDEIASSVATMQSASPLEEVASLVLQRNPQDADAKYVHFFHEKIPSRQLAQCTNLDALSEIISEKSTQGEPLRTRATVRIFKEDFEGAVADLTEALRIHRFYRLPQNAPKYHNHPQARPGGRRQEDIVLKEEEQPNSLEIQLLFQRAGVYLTIACQHVQAAFPSKHAEAKSAARKATDVDDSFEGDKTSSDPIITVLTTAEQEAEKKVMEARKLVRHNAKRALKDYMNYLSHFEYSPDLPIEIAEDFARKVNYAANGVRVPRSFSHASRSDSPVTGEPGESQPTHRIFALSDLFAASPPADLPPYPSTELTPVRPQQQPPKFAAYQTTTETLTYHPLMNDALHALLLCHCLIQTSAKELLRHAYMVARLARLADGYPIFQASRSPARADWTEVLRASGNYIQLAGTWEDLCAPAPLPLFQPSGPGGGPVPVALPGPVRQNKALPPPATSGSAETGAVVRLSSANGTSSVTEAEKHRKERIQHQAIIDALGDDRIKDEASFRMAVKARQLRAENDYRLDNAVAAMDAKLTGRDFESLALEAPPPKDTTIASPATNGSKSTLKPTNGSASTSTALTRTTSSAANSNGTTTNTNGVAKPTANTTNGGTAPQPAQNIRRWSVDDGKEYPISTDRASAIARWVLEAPPNAGLTSGNGDGATRRKKKKVVSKGRAGSGSAGGLGLGLGAAAIATGANCTANNT
ncbi:hypothetical protein QBC45DRAFT_485322 [Copromyces sp. CBS 386.78]|nr:hypothetical protein QBC45DRAFT_485322 [Copromyces sp. CBS 386.78]